MTLYQIAEVEADSGVQAYQPFGAAVELWKSQAREVLIVGPSETGKTLVCLHKLDGLMWKYPKSQAAMVRKQYTDMPGSCIQTYEKRVLGAWNPERNEFDQTLTPVHKYGGEKPQFYTYPNGSRIWVGGLDNPGKTLSSERDFIYINQAEELSSEDWEILTTRATGRAGNAPYTQILADANPTVCSHWMYERHRDGKLELLQSVHEDNPTLYNRDGTLTAQGRITMGILDNLTGVRRIRLRDGKCANVEGMVYDWDPAIHLIDRFEIPADWTRFRCVDFGTSHPFVCGWWAVDHDGRMYLYRYIYMTGRTVESHATKIKRESEGESISITVCDHDAGDRLTLSHNGIPNIPAKKDVLWGIDKVNQRLKKAVDGKPRLFILKNSLVEVDQSLVLEKKPYRVEMEFENYVWASTAKEQPVKRDDHGCDMVRYAVAYQERPGWVRGS